MQRTYLEEDVRLIQKYFPGARTVALRTPFDLTDQPIGGRSASTSTFHDTTSYGWKGEAAWAQ